MKKFLPYIGIVVVFMGFFTPLVSVEAQAVGTCVVTETAANAGPPETHTNITRDACEGFRTSTKVVQWTQTGTTNTETLSTPTPVSSCTDLTNFSIAGCIARGLGWISFLLLQIMSLLLGLAGLLLNYVVNETVVKITTNISGMTGINTVWKVIRDLMNIAFIWLLLYEAIRLIIGQSDTAKVKKLITGIVLASILINFSLFFTKLLIDASNVVTIGFYNGILGEDQTRIDNGYGLSNAFQQSLGLQGIFSGKNVENFSKISAGGDDYAMLIIGLMASILFLVTMFVFLAVSVLFVVRYIVLLVLLMLSPIGYMGFAFPSMQKHQSTWWTSLTGQLLFAPVYMIMTWVMLTLMTSSNFIIVPDKWAELAGGVGTAGAPSPSSIGLLFNFIVIIGLAIASLVVSKGFATQGASQIKDLTGKLTSFAGGAVLGSAGKLGRNTLGRAGNAIANNERLKDSASRGGIGGFFAKGVLQAGDRTAKSTFDARSTKAGAGLLGALGGKDMFGKGADAKKVNFQKDLAAKEKSAADFAKTLKPSDAVEAKLKKETEGNKERAKSLHDQAKKDLTDLYTKRTELTERLKTEGLTQEERDGINRELDQTEQKIDRQTVVNETLKKDSDAAEKAAKAKDEEVKKRFSDRVTDYAKTFENENGMLRWTKNILKIPVGPISSLTPNSKADNQAIGRAIRKASKPKSAADLRKEADKKDREEAKARGEEVEKDDDEEKTDKKDDDKPKEEDKKTS